MTINTQACIDTELFKRLEEFRWKFQMSRSKIVSEALKMYLDKKEKDAKETEE